MEVCLIYIPIIESTNIEYIFNNYRRLLHVTELTSIFSLRMLFDKLLSKSKVKLRKKVLRLQPFTKKTIVQTLSIIFILNGLLTNEIKPANVFFSMRLPIKYKKRNSILFLTKPRKLYKKTKKLLAYLYTYKYTGFFVGCCYI